MGLRQKRDGASTSGEHGLALVVSQAWPAQPEHQFLRTPFTGSLDHYGPT